MHSHFFGIIAVMTLHLLMTKLNIPQLRPALVPRPMLIEKLNSGLNGRLSLVSAPAGFGKTTLVTAWLNQLSTSSRIWKTEHCTWISLDDQDNEPVRFLRYFIAAIQVVYPALGIELQEILEISPKPNTLAITQDLLNEITEYDQPLLIILDDFHEIHNEIIHHILQTIIDFLPHQTHIVIITRQAPPLSLPRWRARNWLSDVTAIDLRFDQVETGDFLHRTMQLDLSPEAVSLLEKRTEGWVAGLQLAALSLADTNFSPDVIEEFGGRDRYVAEYLLTEVLNQQTSEVQQFLLPTAVLDRLNADLCTAVIHPEVKLGKINLRQKYQELIETLERSNLFIVPLDRTGYWYRYHHLFAQLLRQRLEQTWSPDDIRALYRRAAYWYAAHEFIDESINHALKGEDYEFVAHLITDLELDILWNQTWGLQLRQWGAALPPATLLDYPKAALHIALAHMTRNEFKEAVYFIELVREDPRIKTGILLVDSIFIRNKGDLPQALNLATEAARLLEDGRDALQITAKTQVIVCLMSLGDLTGAEDLATALRYQIQGQAREFLNVHIQVMHILGVIKEQRGKLVEAERVYLEGIDTIQQSGITLPLIGLLQVRLGAIYYLWNEIEKATEFCETGLAWGDRTGIADITTQGLLVQVDLAIYRKDNTAVENILARLSKLLEWPEFGDFSSIIRANQAFFNVRLGNLASAIRWADSSGFSLEDQVSWRYRTEYQTLVRVRYEEIRHLGLKTQVPKVIALVDQLIELGTKHGFGDVTIYCRALKALLFDLNGQTKNALDSLHDALDLAFPGGSIRNVVDFGAPMRDLLQKSLAYDPHMGYKRRLLLAFTDDEITPVTSVSSTHEIPVTLTPREFETLQLIAAGLSNKAIQESLMLSKNTIRTHIKNLYSKLGVHSRTQAIQQARKNGLI